MNKIYLIIIKRCHFMFYESILVLKKRFGYKPMYLRFYQTCTLLLLFLMFDDSQGINNNLFIVCFLCALNLGTHAVN